MSVNKEVSALLCQISHLGKGVGKSSNGQIYFEILHALPVGLIFLDKQGRVQWYNEQAQKLLNTPLLSTDWQTCLTKISSLEKSTSKEIILKDGGLLKCIHFSAGESQQQAVLLLNSQIFNHQ